MQSLQNKAKTWLTPLFDTNTQQEVRALLQDPEKLKEHFGTDLSFGTGGLRGLMGVGTNRMNRYTVRKTTHGLVNALRHAFPHEQLSVVIGFDSRLYSEAFAKEAKETLLHAGINVLFIQELRPTPVVSFACRYHHAHAAIMITASHNPKEYNGYKVYWNDGAQVTAPHDEEILKEIARITTYATPISSVQGKETLLLPEIDTAYLQAIKPLQLSLNTTPIDILYTSLHGTGIPLVPNALASWGFSCTLLKEQCIPDGKFPTVKIPNPELRETLALGLKALPAHDILLATDPDADRLAVAIMHQGSYICFTGNEIAALCVDYLCRTLQNQKTLSPNAAIVTTIVSTDLLSALATSYGIRCVRVLTGFKYIGECIRLWEQDPSHQPSFLFGAEESYGYLYGTHARDKDGIIAACLVALIAADCKQHHQTLFDYLCQLYHTHGIFAEETLSIDYPQGEQGLQEMRSLMTSLRTHPPQALGNHKVIEMQDFLDTATTQLPSSDVLLFRFDDGSRVIIRPSGTEPKLKVYASTHHRPLLVTQEAILSAKAATTHLLSHIHEWRK